MQVVVGDFDAENQREDGEQRKEICRKIVHQGYSPHGAIVDDIALLELCEPVEMNHRVQPIGLAPFSLNEEKMTGNPNVTVAGWGTTSEGGRQSRYLQAVVVPLVSNALCQKSYGFINDGHICAGLYHYGGKDSCQGDSGGPLWWMDPETQQPLQVS